MDQIMTPELPEFFLLGIINLVKGVHPTGKHVVMCLNSSIARRGQVDVPDECQSLRSQTT